MKNIKWFGILSVLPGDRFLIHTIIDLFLLMPLRLGAIIAALGSLVALTALSGKRPKGVKGDLFIIVPLTIGAIGALSFLANLWAG